jgi:CheY-like chemotaxis protein
MTGLDGKRILVIEDEFIVSAMAVEMIEALGASLAGSASSLAAALRIAETAQADVALLDVNLNGERSDAVADALAARGIPVVFATGYGAGAWRPPPGARLLDKPYTQERLAAALAAAIAAGA